MSGAVKHNVARLAISIALGLLLVACGSGAKLVTTALGSRRKSVEIAREKFAMDAPHAREVLAKRGTLGLTNTKQNRYENGFDSSDGYHYSFPDSVDWRDLAPGILTFSSFQTEQRLTRYDAGSLTPTWILKIDTGDPSLHCGPKWLRTGVTLLLCVSDSKTDVLTFNVSEGSLKPLASIPHEADVVFAESAQRFVAISYPDSTCGGCLHVSVHSLIDGSVISRAQISPKDARSFEGGVSAHSFGFDGRLLWSYTPESPTERDPRMRLWEEPRTYGFCYYEVFDLALGGTRIRTLDDATGAWDAAKRECKVRDLIALPDGGVMALRETVEQQAHVTEAITFSAPP